jgi:hypothetical protein
MIGHQVHLNAFASVSKHGQFNYENSHLESSSIFMDVAM